MKMYVKRERANGTWITHDNGRIYCSICGARALYRNLDKREKTDNYKPVRAKYCSACGASMTAAGQDTQNPVTILDIIEQYTAEIEKLNADCERNTKGAASDEEAQFFSEEFYKNRQTLMENLSDNIVSRLPL